MKTFVKATDKQRHAGISKNNITASPIAIGEAGIMISPLHLHVDLIITFRVYMK